MSQLSVLNNAIEKLEVAEKTLDDARDAFDPDGEEYGKVTDQFEVIGDAIYIIKSVWPG